MVKNIFKWFGCNIFELCVVCLLLILQNMTEDSDCNLSRSGNPLPLLRKEEFHCEEEGDARYIRVRACRQIYQIVEVQCQAYARRQVRMNNLNREDRNVAQQLGIPVPDTEEPLITGENKRLLFCSCNLTHWGRWTTEDGREARFQSVI